MFQFHSIQIVREALRFISKIDWLFVCEKPVKNNNKILTGIPLFKDTQFKLQTQLCKYFAQQKRIATFDKITTMNLQELFTDLFIRIGFTQNDTAVKWNELKKAYSHASRKYHNLNHLEEMITAFTVYQKELQYPDEVLYAIFYHDYVYKSTRKDNELKSAEYALAILPKSNVAMHKERVYDMILATKDHICHDNKDEKWLIDFDLKILAKDWENYKVYYEQIRKEYSIYPDFLYTPGRKKALTHFLENEYIYQTDEFRKLYESKARENIKKEISLLNS